VNPQAILEEGQGQKEGRDEGGEEVRGGRDAASGNPVIKGKRRRREGGEARGKPTLKSKTQLRSPLAPTGQRGGREGRQRGGGGDTC